MRTQRQVSVGELVEEAKKRIVFLIVSVIGLSYLMSLTSSSVWINLPAAASLILLLRYFSLDYEMRRKAATYSNSKASSTDPAFPQNPQLTRNCERSDWRKKVNSPVVEEAVDHFTRHLISEWVTDLWYSRLTPDKDGPEELVQIVNGVIGEFSSRMRNLNLIDLLIRDLIHLICTHLELFRATQGKIEKHPSGLLSFEQRDKEMRRVLAADNRLHPALFSAEAEHKVLQHVMDGLVSFTFRPEDLQCSFFRFVVRELLACAVMRPVLNLANPRFINERIEILVLSRTNKGVATAEEASQSNPDESSKTPSDHFSRNLDPTAVGVELVQLKGNQSKKGSGSPEKDKTNGIHSSKDPLLSIDTRSSRSWSSLPSNPKNKDEVGIPRFRSGGEWGDMLDVLSQRKSAALAPENFENMWTKGRNYRKKDDKNWSIERISQNKIIAADKSKTSIPKEKHGLNTSDVFLARNGQSLHLDQGRVQNSYHRTDQNSSNHSLWTSYDEDDGDGLLHMDEFESGSASPYTSEEEDPSSVTGLDDPGTKVWDRKTNRNLTVSPIHHPLENPHHHGSKKTSRGQAHYEKVPRPQSGRKRLRPSNQKAPAWQEVERTSFLSGDGQDLLSSKGHSKLDASSDDSEVEGLARAYSGATACSSAISDSISEIHCSAFNSTVDSFFKLKCEVTGANIVKSASRTFAVYSISVTDVNNNSWSIKRRFRHFEELHRRLKEYPEYNLHLPPKHFLSTGLDMPVIQERCKLLDRYLKKLLQLPTISGSIEVWDFLSVDSQTYIFSNSFSIVQTLSVDLDDKPTENSRTVANSVGLKSSSSSQTGKLETERKESASQTKCKFVADGVRMAPKHNSHSPVRKLGKESGKLFEESASIPDAQKNALSVRNIGKTVEGRQTDRLEPISESLHDPSADPTVPTEWVSPNLTAPILDLVDVVFQLQDGGWIRRQAFWVAKQILQLGMGDALDDWLIEKIQLLRMGPVVASGIKRLEQILWPDGIFLTKHPRRRQSSTNNTAYSSPHGQQPANMSSPKLSSSLARQPSEISSPRLSDELQQQEADRRAKFVYELMIDNAPATIVSLVGRKEYEQCAKDLYFFLQSSVCLKLLAFELLELLLLSTFPQLDYVFRQLHEEKHRFGELKIE